MRARALDASNDGPTNLAIVNEVFGEVVACRRRTRGWIGRVRRRYRAAPNRAVAQYGFGCLATGDHGGDEPQHDVGWVLPLGHLGDHPAWGVDALECATRRRRCRFSHGLCRPTGLWVGR